MPDAVIEIPTGTITLTGQQANVLFVRVTQELLEAMRGEAADARATQEVVETFQAQPAAARATQETVEWFWKTNSDTRATHELIEIYDGTPSRIDETQELVEVFLRLVPAPPIPSPTTTRQMRRLRRAQHLSADGVWLFYQRFQLDLEAGVGLATGQGSDPQLMLRWSDDGGHTWSNEHWVSAGQMGEYLRRAVWRRLGRSRDRVFEVTISDPVKVAWIDAWVDTQPGVS